MQSEFKLIMTVRAEAESVTAEARAIAPKTGYVPGLDGIRALAIGFVLVSHCLIYDQDGRLRQLAIGAGNTGVTLFFVLSGFLITTIMLNENERRGRISLGHFYFRRALRLFPALWLYLATVAVLWKFGLFPEHPWHSFVTSLLYIRNIIGRGHETGHLWSLSIEEQFYIVWPMLFIALRRQFKARIAIVIVSIIAIAFWRAIAEYYSFVSEWTLYFRSDFRFDAPLIGCALALILHADPKAVGRLNASGVRSSILFAVGGIGIAALIGLKSYGIDFERFDSTMIALASVALILSQIGRQSRVTRVLSTRPLIALGRISYGVYLWQQLFLGPKNADLEIIRSFPVGLILTFASAFLSYWAMERPLNRLKDSLFQSAI